MTLREFRQLVRAEFGGDLRYMTPANVRAFLDRVHDEVEAPPGPGERFYLNEPERTYEGILRDFLSQALEMPSDQAVIRLWLYCLELTTASVTEVEAERFRKLFAGLAAGDGLD
ncbi:MAG: hypothetical protein ACK47B_01770 [Armatimonadota bacterium]